MGDIVKLLLMKLIRLLVANTGVATVMIIVINIRDDADLGIRYIGKDGPVADFEHLGFEAGPQTFGLGVIVAFALPGTTAPAVRELGVGPVQQGFVGVAHVLATPVGVHNQTRGGPLGQQRSLQGIGDQGFGHVGPHLPALPGTTHHVLGAHVLKGAQVGPRAIG